MKIDESIELGIISGCGFFVCCLQTDCEKFYTN